MRHWFLICVVYQYIANPPSDPAAQAYYQQPPYYQNGPPQTSQMGQASGFIGQAPMGSTPYDPRAGAGYNRPAENPFGDDKAPREHNPFEEVKV